MGAVIPSGATFISGVGFGGVPLAGEGRGVGIGFGACGFDGKCGLEVGVGVIKFAGPRGDAGRDGVSGFCSCVGVTAD